MRRIVTRLAVLLALVGALAGALAVYDRPPVAPGTWLAAAGLEARHETVDGHRLRYVRAGSGPAVVLVHGFGSSLYTWKDVIPALAAGHDVVALDLPGFGQSDQPADLSFEDFPRAVLGLMDRLGIGRAAARRQQHGRGDRRDRRRGEAGAGGRPGADRRRGLQPRTVGAAAHGELRDVPRRLAPRPPARQAPRGGGLAAPGLPRRLARHARAPLGVPRRRQPPGHLPRDPLARRLVRGPAGGRRAVAAPHPGARRSSCGATTTAGSRSPTPTGSWPPSPARGRSSSRPAATCRRRRSRKKSPACCSRSWTRRGPAVQRPRSGPLSGAPEATGGALRAGPC